MIVLLHLTKWIFLKLNLNLQQHIKKSGSQLFILFSEGEDETASGFMVNVTPAFCDKQLKHTFLEMLHSAPFLCM